ncbi:shikimate kinase [Antarcticibacterium flavum]|uniref:Shikimate kinase n=1 Tax=Antarcticibacterium flavum TaxID=2058175 RepID=A0A5B7X522_9FLAO|nr:MULTISPECIES: shikimate kinase [Antarcticibacterium]MCM4159946.1 shikimate kinase [Antarcticibacterium sp. W02-3]QCY70459.1 shikimate kinase [Antarcticibacterium flavum]
MKIFLTGYMGSGKSVVGKVLAGELDFTFIDLDDQIALIEEKPVPEIFNTRGELFFRRLETEVLKDVIEDPAALVISLGGGTPCYGNNLELIKQAEDAKTVYLKASVGFLTKRLFEEKETRPVISHLSTRELLEDFIRKHLFERSFYYNQANVIIDVENKTPQEIVKELMEKL